MRRSTDELSQSGGTIVALQSLWRLPGIYVAMFLVRGLCIAAFVPLFHLAGSGALVRLSGRGLLGLDVLHPTNRNMSPKP